MKKNELLLILYLFIFTILNILLETFKSYSTMILFFATMLILATSIIINSKTKKIFSTLINNNLKTVITTLLMILLFLIELLIFKENNKIIQYLYYFIIYAIIPCYLYMFAKDIRKCLEYYTNFSILLILMYGMTPIIKNVFFSDYMSFGFNCILPATVGLYIGIRYLGRKKLIILEVVAILELILFCNRGAILTAIIFIVLYELIIKKKTGKKLLLFFISFCVLILVLVNLSSICNIVIDYLEDRNLYSYAFNKLYNYINNKDNNVLSGRDAIWKQCIEEYKLHPFIGNGIANFEKKYEHYPHNIFLDVLTNFGILGMLVFLYTITKGIYKITKSKDEEKVWGLLLGVMGIVPLLFSLTMFNWIYFWLFIHFSLKK